MEKRTLKLYSAVLSITTLMSSLPILTPNAAEVSVNTQSQSSEISMAEEESSNQFYGATGDRSLENGGIPESATVIDSVYEYYQIAEQDSNISEDDLRMKADNDLPDSVDNSNSKYFPEVKSQGSIGSCVAWAETYYQFTYTMNKTMNVETTSENTFSPKWTYNLANGGEDEGSVSDDVYEIMKAQGNVPWSMVPYDDDYLSWSPVEDIWKTAIKYRIKDYQFFKDIGYKENSMITSADDIDLEPIKTALSNGDVLTFSTHIRSWKTSNLKTNSNAPENSNYNGEVVVIAQNGSLGGHRMTIVGYNDNIWTDINNNDIVDDGEMGAFKIANSWGSNYANDGFIWVSYDSLNQISSVTNAENATNRSKPICSVARIDVQPYDTDTDLYLKYTLNTSDRTQVKGYVIAEKNGTEYYSSVYPHVMFGQTGVYSYDGTTSSNDGTMIFALNNIIPDINSDNYSEYTWSVKFEDNTADSTVLTVKTAEIIDENTNKTYKPENIYPFTLDGEEKTLEISKTALNNAVIYYRGYENPYIHYKVGNGSWTSDAGIPMTKNMERRGYTHKYVIELADSSETTFYFSDGNDNIDNNNGQYFIASKGLNYYVTENVCDPIVVKLTNDFNSIADVDKCGNFYAEASGGYVPYQYQFIYENLTTGEEKVYDYDDYSNDGYYFREVGDYKVTVNVKDFADNVASDSMIVTVEEFPFEFTEFNVKPNGKIVVGQALNFSAITNFEHIKAWGGLNNKYNFTIKREDEVCYTTTILSDKYDIGGMTSTILLSWTPTYSGSYSITISSTEGDGEYAEKTINFDVAEYNGTLVGDANNDKKITIADPVIIMRYIVGLVDSSGIWTYLADCNNDGNVDIKDAVYIQKYLLAIKNSSNVGSVNYKEPPTEPTTATEPITEPITEPPTEVEENIVTFTNSFNWSGTISCYYWSSSNTSMTTWPGKAMTYLKTNSYGEKMYTFEVPEDATYIIFTNGSYQTVDIPYAGGEVRYYPISTTDSKGHYNVATW